VRGETLDRPAAPVRTAATSVRPVMLLTLNVPFDDRAVDFAVETAAETGAVLYVCDAVPIALGNPASHGIRSFGEHETRNDLDRVSQLARQSGVRATQFVFHNPKPVKAVLEVIRDEQVGLLVFGANRSWLGRWSFRRAARRLRREAGCLVWTNE
jgi:nucleotide-binding universal stress UspA family protein